MVSDMNVSHLLDSFAGILIAAALVVFAIASFFVPFCIISISGNLKKLAKLKEKEAQELKTLREIARAAFDRLQ